MILILYYIVIDICVYDCLLFHHVHSAYDISDTNGPAYSSDNPSTHRYTQFYEHFSISFYMSMSIHFQGFWFCYVWRSAQHRESFIWAHPRIRWKTGNNDIFLKKNLFIWMFDFWFQIDPKIAFPRKAHSKVITFYCRFSHSISKRNLFELRMPLLVYRSFATAFYPYPRIITLYDWSSRRDDRDVRLEQEIRLYRFYMNWKLFFSHVISHIA